MKNPNTPQHPDGEMTAVQWFKLCHDTARELLRDTRSRVIQAVIAAAVGAAIGTGVAFVFILGLEILCRTL